jgi:hypothetical protein
VEAAFSRLALLPAVPENNPYSLKSFTIYFAAAVILLLQHSCSPHQPMKVEEGGGSYSINLQDAPPIVLDSLIEDIKIIPIKSNSRKSIGIGDIGVISKILSLHDTLFLLNSKFNSINTIDPDGNYLYNIGKIGLHEDAFIRAEDLVYNKFERLLCVVCNSPAKTVEYSSQGKFIKAIKSPFYSSSINIETPDLIYHYVNQNNSRIANGHNLLLTDGDYKYVDGSFAFSKIHTGMLEYTGGFFSTKNAVYFNNAYSNKIFKMRGTVVSEYANVTSTSQRSLKDSLNKDKQNFLGKIFIETDRYLLFNYVIDNLYSLFLYDKAARKVYSLASDFSSLGFILKLSNIAAQGDEFDYETVVDLKMLKGYVSQYIPLFEQKYPTLYHELFENREGRDTTTTKELQLAIVKLKFH